MCEVMCRILELVQTSFRAAGGGGGAGMSYFKCSGSKKISM